MFAVRREKGRAGHLHQPRRACGDFWRGADVLVLSGEEGHGFSRSVRLHEDVIVAIAFV